MGLPRFESKLSGRAPRPDVVVWALLWLIVASLGQASGSPAKAIDFNREIRPILSENCYSCHGPDEGRRKAGLRLDLKGPAYAELKSGSVAVVPNNPEKSALIKRVVSADPDEVMPPPKSGKKLGAAQLALLKEWVGQGAKWSEHWSYVPPERPALPEIKSKASANNEIDTFVLARLEAEGLKPSPEADKATLGRRVTLDLTGLPPTIDELDAFLVDKNPDAYEKLVDRLLSMEQYGERMAVSWLDLARYADTSGYHNDSPRFMWLWRDWVIKAFNKNMPFDQFTTEQIAGDLLPNATLEQKVATGFYRNGMTNDEGGADAAEYLNKYIVDRVATTGAVWLGTTLGCAECHDHKFDPVSQKEFYQLYAFFHNVPEKGMDGTRTENPLPRISVPTPQQASELLELDRGIAQAESAVRDEESKLAAGQDAWEKGLATTPAAEPGGEGLIARFKLDDSVAGIGLSNGEIPASFKGEGEPKWTEARLGKGLILDGKSQFIEAGKTITLDRTNAFSYGGWINFRGSGGALFSRMKDDQAYRGFDLLVSDGFIEAHLIHEFPGNALKIRSKQKFAADTWLHVMVAHDGTSKAAGLKLYVNGQVQETEVQHDKLSDSIVADTPFVIGKRSASMYFNGIIDDVRIYNRALPEPEIKKLALQGVLQLALIPKERRSPAQAEELRKLYRESFAEGLKKAEQGLAAAKSAKGALLGRIPNTMVMQEMETPRDTFVLVRGNFQQKAEKVTADVPRFLPRLPEGAKADRLGLAKWLVAKNHPLTSRVAVNRFWQMFFGTGLVKTANDFGSQGEWPSHPELLEWLSCQFRDGGGGAGAKPWDVKALVKLIVMSGTYRQSAAVTPRLLERDLYNRLLTRGPRLRLEAEFVRDNALAISGLLNPKIGGESVRPYQLAGLWDVTPIRYDQSHGADLYRRGLYVYWKRAAHYPTLATFDAPNRETCTAQRPRTSTPLQSLVLMNDTVYVEAARAFAARMIREGGSDPEDRLTFAFRTALARRPTPRELAILTDTLEDARKVFGADPVAAANLLKVGESPNPANLNEAELAAYASVANVILNLNETITH